MEWSFTIKFCDQDISWSRKFVGLSIKKSVLTIKIGVWPWNWNQFWPWKLLTILSALECQSRTWTWHFGAGSLGNEVATFPGYTAWERGLNPSLSVEICCLNWNLSPQLKIVASKLTLLDRIIAMKLHVNCKAFVDWNWHKQHSHTGPPMQYSWQMRTLRQGGTSLSAVHGFSQHQVVRE